MCEASSKGEDFPLPPSGREGEREEMTPDRDKGMCRGKIGDERAYFVLNLCSTRLIVLYSPAIVKSF